MSSEQYSGSVLLGPWPEEQPERPYLIVADAHGRERQKIMPDAMRYIPPTEQGEQ